MQFPVKHHLLNVAQSRTVIECWSHFLVASKAVLFPEIFAAGPLHLALTRSQPEEVAEPQEWKPRLRQTARPVGAVRIDDQTPHELALRVEIGPNES
jgi:hypothetical protein